MGWEEQFWVNVAYRGECVASLLSLLFSCCVRWRIAHTVSLLPPPSATTPNLSYGILQDSGTRSHHFRLQQPQISRCWGPWLWFCFDDTRLTFGDFCFSGRNFLYLSTCSAGAGERGVAWHWTLMMGSAWLRGEAKWAVALVLSFGYNKVRARSWVLYGGCLNVAVLWEKGVLDFLVIAQGNDQVIPTVQSLDASEGCYPPAGLLAPMEDSPEEH